MVRKKRTKEPAQKKEVDMEDVDDDIEDINMDDITDSEEEYTETEKKLLEKVRNKNTIENYDSEDEVYGLQDSEEDDQEEQESMESDIEELQEDYDIPNDRAWGSKARTFYSSDFKYTDYAFVPQKDLINADIEEEEGRKLHVRSLEQFLDIDSFDLTGIVQAAEHTKDRQEDSEQVSVQETDEKFFMTLVNSFKECLVEVKTILSPFLKLVEDGTCPNCNAVDFVRTKYHVLLNYCINVSFCLMMKAKGLSVKSHPVIKRLAQYRQLLDQLLSGQGNLLEQVADVVKAAKEGKPLYAVSDGSQIEINKKPARLTGLSKKLARQKEAAAAKDEEEELLSNSMDEASMSEGESIDKDVDTKEEHDDEAMENEKNDANEETKRAITYEMAKNRGLTPYRKKELRNPRVKHRNKYRKAKIRRKGAVREVRKELTRYAGEISGIKAGAKKGIKLK
ncbi:hypothetical protein DMN91_004738 [Ooceraea biroi]|uniref:Something about silencing protein n=1 Tax=Ooceraea biroi TaxID=2015173 RepID=A0A026WB23_OOCBI|nr:something about silencing protein 10 [Ooceraea biroi]EZA53302.1 Something about silencing protein [Ooceraea biroi]RLU22460.1 hypothetical protein DMN91_004738 [Ooceraea biroi]